MSLKLEEHVVYIESMKTDMIPYSVVKQYLVETVAEQQPALDNITNTVQKAETEIFTALNDLTKELGNLNKL